jgi:hypothetical protein
MPPTEDVIEVRIVGMPLDVYRAAAEHFDELKREFALLRMEDDVAESIPNRLLEVSDQLSTRYARFTSSPNEARDRALHRGDKTVDLDYQVPVSVRDACIELERLLDEADEFCRAGEHLLTLAATPEVVSFRRWFLTEFVRQIDGEDPTSWAEYKDAIRRAV